MKIQNKKSKKKAYLLSALIILIVLGSGATYAFTNSNKSSKQDMSSSNSKPENTTADNEDSNSSSSEPNESNSKTKISSQDVDTNKSTNEIPQNKTLSASVDQLSQANGVVTYKASLNDTTASGTCSAEFTTDGAKPVTNTTSAKNGNCGPVSIPEIQFSKLGDWKFTFRYYSNNSQTSATKNITIN